MIERCVLISTIYITNDRKASKAGIVREANARCHQENLIEQLKNGVRALRVPVDGLVSNWAYMVMASLAWNLKAWYALSLPSKGRWKEKRLREKKKILRMEFKKFRHFFMMLPCQLVKTGRDTCSVPQPDQPKFPATMLPGTLVLGLGET